MKNIVVGIDFSKNSLNALKHACSLSLRTGGKLHLVWVKTPTTTNAIGVSKSQVSKKAEEKLEEYVAECKKEVPKSEIISVILEGKSAAELTKYTANLQNSVLVMGTHGASGFEDETTGSNAMRALGLTKVPILILREGVKITRDLIQVLVPIDTSFETLQKMKYAITFAKAFSAKVMLLGLKASKNPEMTHVINVQLGHAIAMCEQANVRFSAATIDVTGNAAKAVIDFASKEDVNLITVMREEEDDFSTFWLGTTTRQLASISPIPLLVIPNVNHTGVAK